jgi:hypothetical protein
MIEKYGFLIYYNIMSFPKTAFIVLSVFCLTSLFSSEKDYSKGPFFGKNMYVPFLIYYNFPGFRASEGKLYEFDYHISTYYIQDFSAYKLRSLERTYDPEQVARDYEGLVVETGASFNILKNLQVGMELRLVSYYTGVLDAFVENYHRAFGFPNGGRESFEQNRININLPNANDISLFLTKPSVAFGDIDLYMKYTYFQRTTISLAVVGALKLPTGNMQGLSGSGYPDIGVQLLADFKPHWVITLYFQAGFVLPYDTMIRYTSKPNPMYNGMVSIELSPVKFFSIIGQLNIKTSPITSGKLRNSWVKTVDQLSLPQVNTLIGFVFQYRKFRWQFYFEEDTFTNQGTDFTVNLMFSQKISFTRQ